jgi:hypothetical protein
MLARQMQQRWSLGAQARQRRWPQGTRAASRGQRSRQTGPRPLAGLLGGVELGVQGWARNGPRLPGPAPAEERAPGRAGGWASAAAALGLCQGARARAERW